MNAGDARNGDAPRVARGVVGDSNKAKSADKPGSVTALARYGRHSSRPVVAAGLKPPTRGLDEQPVLPNARPPTWCCSGWRLPRFTRRRLTAGDSSLWPCSSPSSTARAATYSGRALPGILLCGARTFLSPRLPGQRRSGWLRTSRIAPAGVRVPGATRQRIVLAGAQRHERSRRRTDTRRARSRTRARASPCRRCAAVRRSPRRSGSRSLRAGRARRPLRTLRRRAAARAAPSSSRRSSMRSPSCARACGAESVPRKNFGLPDVAAARARARCDSRFRIGRQ